MEHAICWNCTDEWVLKEIIRKRGEPAECSVCHESGNNAFSVGQLGELLEPILRQHFRPGDTVPRFEPDDSEWLEQQGESLADIIQEVMNQYFDFEDDIVDAVISAEPRSHSDGDPPFFDASACYVPAPINLTEYYEEWESAERELKNMRRFFSSGAKALFDKLFSGVEKAGLLAIRERIFEDSVRSLPENSELFRARACGSLGLLEEMFLDPFKYVGPPPADQTRAGRMNVAGVVVFYGSLDRETCLAEMRPAIGDATAMITVRTTKPLQLLDFTQLAKSYTRKTLSYFQEDFSEQLEKGEFLRRLQGLISKPVSTSSESNYLITQVMTEYLEHFHHDSLDGILFASAQREGGVNIVLFPQREVLAGTVTASFRILYVDKSIKIFTTQAIKYEHREKDILVDEGGEIVGMEEDIAFDDY